MRAPAQVGQHDKDAFLRALSELGARVQRARSVDAVLETAGSGLAALGVHLSVGVFDGSELRLRYIASKGPMFAELTRGMVDVKSQLRGPPLPGGLAQKVYRERRSLFSEAIAADILALAKALPEVNLERLEKLIAAGGFGRGLLAPVLVRDEVWGIASMTSLQLGPDDAPPLELFAAHLGASIEVAETIEDLERRNRELAAIHEVAAASKSASIAELAQTVQQIAARETKSDSAAVYLLDDATAQLLQAAPPHMPGREDGHARPALPIQSTLMGAALLARQPRLHTAADWPPEQQARVAALGMSEFMFLPLLVQGRPTGLLVLARTSNRYSERELRSAALLAAQIAIQVENARLYADAQRRLRQITLMFRLSRLAAAMRDVPELMERLLEELLSALPIDMAIIYLLDGGVLRSESVRWRTGGPRPLPPPLAQLPLNDQSTVGRSVLTRATTVANGTLPPATAAVAAELGMRSVVASPMATENEILGSLLVARAAPESGWTDEEVLLVEHCSAQMAVAIEHTRLFEEQRRRVADLSLINELGALINQHLNLDTVFRVGVEKLAKLADVPNAYLMLVDEQRASIKMVASTTEGAATIPLSAPSAATFAIRSARPVVIDDVANDARANRELSARYGNRALMALPLISEGEAVGAVILGDPREGRRFSQTEVERALTVANQLATAISNAQLFNDLKKSYDQLAATQAELVRRERLAVLGELSAVMAHELRNPLGVIFNSISSLRKILSPKGDAELLLGIVGEEADRLNRIVGDLLDFARPYEATVKPIVLEQVLASAIEGAMQALPQNIKVVSELSRTPASFTADGHMLRQALMNLVINGGQAMPRGGEVHVRVSSEHRRGKDVVRIDVRDGGIGIAPQHASKIFQPFFTTKATGTGLGLAVVKRIVDAHHGEIEVQSNPGQGATFTMWLPAAAMAL